MNDTTVEIATLRVRITHLESLNTLLHEEIQRLREQNFALNDEAKKLVKERDAARLEVCELSGNGSIDSASREAEARGWKLEEENDDNE